MKVTLSFFGQIRKVTVLEKETLELPEGSNLLQAIAALTDSYGQDFSNIVSGDGGGVRSSIILLLNGVPANRDCSSALSDGDSVSLLSAVAGG
jgi:MoaD family protein